MSFSAAEMAATWTKRKSESLKLFWGLCCLKVRELGVIEEVGDIKRAGCWAELMALVVVCIAPAGKIQKIEELVAIRCLNNYQSKEMEKEDKEKSHKSVSKWEG